MSAPRSKTELRNSVVRVVAGYSPAVRRALDENIEQRLRVLPEFQGASQLLAYLPLRDEPALIALLEDAIAQGKRVYMPVVDERLALHYVRWTPRDGKQATAHGRWIASSAETPSPHTSMVLVPGMAFDSEGYRLGRGKGCYDRSLASLRSFGAVVGVAYDAQIFSSLPREQHDLAVDIIVTDRQTIRARDVG